jgi:hypothetical protein
MRRLAVLAVVAVIAFASPAAAKGSKPSTNPKKPCQQARSLVIIGDGLGKYEANDLKVLGNVATAIGHTKIKGVDTLTLATVLANSVGKTFADQLAAASVVTAACVAANVIPAPPTTTTTTQLLPQQASGTSDSVIDVTFPASKAALLHPTYNGDSNFVVKGIDSTGGAGDLFVNTIGHYDGVRLLNATTSATPARLQVQAQGPWSITISDANSAPVAMAPGHFDGIGDQVVIMRGSASTGHFHNTGDANFVVNSYSGSSRELLVNEIGAFDGTEIIPSGTILFEVQSNGGWSIDLS